MIACVVFLACMASGGSGAPSCRIVRAECASLEPAQVEAARRTCDAAPNCTPAGPQVFLFAEAIPRAPGRTL